MRRAIGFTLFLMGFATQAALCQGGRGGANAIDSIPSLTAAQRAEVARANETLSQQAAAVAVSRSALAAAVFAEVRNPAAIAVMTGAVREAELALATTRANELARIQASSARLSRDQSARTMPPAW